MDIGKMLQQSGAIDAISRQLGVDPNTVQAGANALIPSIVAGMTKPAAPTAQEPASGGGLGDLLKTVTELGGGQLLDHVVSDQPTDVGKGNQILGQIFGSKDGSRAVAADASDRSGVEQDVLKQMLPMVAMAAAGHVMKQANQGGGLAGALENMLGGGAKPANRS